MRGARFAIALVLLAGAISPEVFGGNIYDATVYGGKPASLQARMPQLPVIDMHQLWDGKEGAEAPSAEKLRSIVAGLPSSPYVVVDIEHWPLRGAGVERTIARLAEVVDGLRAPEGQFGLGLYSTLPIRDYWRAIGAQGLAKIDEWKAENDRLAPLATHVDVLFPCAYTFYPDVEGWKRYARAQVAEARRLAPGKPVMLFLWPEFHDSTPRRGQFLPPSFWAEQLELACREADGAVVWGGWNYLEHRPRKWDPDAAWWLITQAFIDNHSCKGRT